MTKIVTSSDTEEENEMYYPPIEALMGNMGRIIRQQQFSIGGDAKRDLENLFYLMEDELLHIGTIEKRSSQCVVIPNDEESSFGHQYTDHLAQLRRVAGVKIAKKKTPQREPGGRVSGRYS